MSYFNKLIEAEINSHNSAALEFIQNQIFILLKLIENIESPNDAGLVFKTLDEIHIPLSRAVFQHKLKVNEFLNRFITDFDRIDDIEMQQFIFTQIKLKKYISVNLS